MSVPVWMAVISAAHVILDVIDDDWWFVVYEGGEENDVAKWCMDLEMVISIEEEKKMKLRLCRKYLVVCKKIKYEEKQNHT